MKWMMKHLSCFHKQIRPFTERTIFGSHLSSSSSPSCRKGNLLVCSTNHHQVHHIPQPFFQVPSLGGRWFSSASVAEDNSDEQVMKTVPQQPPLSQSATHLLDSASPDEVKVAPLLARSVLLVTRNMEYAHLALGFNQKNRYAIVDACHPKSPVGFIGEQSNAIARQLFHVRRSFVASVTDAMGKELFKVHRPFWWITSTIYAEIDGKDIGVVQKRWHLWRRAYDVYMGKRQFAVVDNPGFWNWTFTLKDMEGNVLANIDRNWRNFGFEVLGDAGNFVIRFGEVDPSSKDDGNAIAIQDMEITRPLTLSERAVVVALVMSLDNDYFSKYRDRIPIFVVQ